MEQVLIDLIKIMISYIIVLIIAYLGINFMSGGYLNKLIAVKISRGKKTLVEIHDVGSIYYRTGIISDGRLIYKNNKKEQKTLIVTNDCIQYRMGLKVISTDAVNNSILKPDFSAVEGFDAVKIDNLIVRALTSPQLQDKILKIIIIVLCIVAFLVVADLFISYKTQKAVNGLYYYLNATRTI